MTTGKRILFVAGAIVALLFAVSPAGSSQDSPGVGSRPPERRTVSPEEAFALMNAEAEKGNAEAMLTLGTLHERGVGTPRNYSKALEWYGKAATAGLGQGYYNVGICFEVGMGTSVDMSKAFSCFESAAKLGMAEGLFKMGMMRLSGIGVEKDDALGVDLLGRALAGGNSQAANNLGMIAFEGSHGQRKDMNKAFDYFSQSAEMGNAEAMKNLAVFFRDGLGRPVDPAQELKWYALARLAGYPAQSLNAVIEAARDKLTGEQVRRVEEEAQAWVKNFRERNNRQAGKR